MKIALVIEKFQPAAGGNERSTHQIATHLVRRGHEVTVLTNAADPTQDLLPGGRVVEARGVPTKFAAGLIGFIRWSRLQIRRGEYDVSFSVSTAVPATVIQPRGGTVRETLARNLAMRRTPLKRLTKRLSIALTPKQWALLAAERRTLHHLDVKRIAAVSSYVADQLFTHYEVRPRRIEIIPNAAEVRRLDSAHRADLRRDVRRSLGLHAGDIVLLFAAMNPGLKGLDPLLQAFAELRKTQKHARLLVAGTLRYGPLERLERLGIRDHVRWLGPTRHMDALYAASDLTVLPTWYDPASKVVLESLLHGVPAVSTLYNGASQWILDPTGKSPAPSPFKPLSFADLATSRRAGRVIHHPRDIADLTQALAELCEPDERRRCSEATEGLDKLITMQRHVGDLEKLFIDAAKASG